MTLLIRILLIACCASSCVGLVIAKPSALWRVPSPRHAARAAACRLALEPDDSDDLMRELKRALSDIDPQERQASDERSIDYFVDDKKGEITGFEENLAKELESV